MSNGGIDTFRVAVDSLMVREFGCLHTYYQVGSVTMDLSGLGNIMYGYITRLLPSMGVHWIADQLQSWKEDTRGQSDPADDFWQIELEEI